MNHSEINRDLPEGATPLDPDEADDLLPSHIRTRGELNVWEQENILVAASWIRRTPAKALDEATIRELHRRMFSETWKWAGRFRNSDKTIGIHWPQIGVAVRNLIEDGRLWIREEVFGLDESAIRLHHRLVQIHPFPNGNGRHARLWCDMLLSQSGRPALAWGGGDLEAEVKQQLHDAGGLLYVDHIGIHVGNNTGDRHGRVIGEITAAPESHFLAAHRQEDD